MQRSVTVSILFATTLLVVKQTNSLAQNRRSQTDAVYAAPGIMVKIGRPTISAVPKLAPVPAVSSITLPRFWSKTDSIKKAEYIVFAQELYKQVKYPISSLREQVEGVVYLNFRVNSDGQVDGATLKKSNLVWSGEATSAAKDALAVEAMRAIKTLRFAPSTSSTDTVTVPIKYGIW